MTEEAAEDVERVLQVLSFIGYLLYWYKSTNIDAAEDVERVLQVLSLLLYWYKSICFTGTKVEEAAEDVERLLQVPQFTCFLVHKYKY